MLTVGGKDEKSYFQVPFRKKTRQIGDRIGERKTEREDLEIEGLQKTSTTNCLDLLSVFFDAQNYYIFLFLLFFDSEIETEWQKVSI